MWRAKRTETVAKPHRRARIVAQYLVGAGCIPALGRIISRWAGVKPAPTNALCNYSEEGGHSTALIVANLHRYRVTISRSPRVLRQSRTASLAKIKQMLRFPVAIGCFACPQTHAPCVASPAVSVGSSAWACTLRGLFFLADRESVPRSSAICLAKYIFAKLWYGTSFLLAKTFSSASISAGRRMEIDFREGFRFGNNTLLAVLESK